MEWEFLFSPAMTCLVHSPISARGIQQKFFFGVSDGEHGWGAKVSTTSLFQQMKCVGRNYSKSVLPTLMIGPVLRGRVDIISSLSHWLMEEE